MNEEWVLPFPVSRDRIGRASEFRTTWVISSIQSLRAHGHYERYLEQVPPAHKEAILTAVAGQWLPMRVARAHYDACHALALSVDDQLAMGGAVGARAQGTLLSTVVKAARGAGVTPWTILPQFDRLWRRGANGGAAAVRRVGPKEAHAEFVGCELFDVPYFRTAFRGVLLGILTLFSEKAYIHDLTPRLHAGAAFRVQWV